MDAAGIDMAIVSLTCPNVYWGTEATSCEAARESNDSMAAAQKRWPDRIRWFTSLPWEYPARAIDELAPQLRRRRGRRHGAGQHRRPQPYRSARSRRSGGEIDRRALPVLVHPTDLPGIDADGHEAIRPELVGRLHRRHHAGVHPHHLRRIPRSLSEPEADRLARRRRAALSGRPLRQGRRGGDSRRGGG